jgi:hypothetical protein
MAFMVVRLLYLTAASGGDYGEADSDALSAGYCRCVPFRLDRDERCVLV